MELDGKYRVYCLECGTLLLEEDKAGEHLPRSLSRKESGHKCPQPRKKATEGNKIEGKIKW